MVPAIPNLLEALEIEDVIEYPNRFSFPCPIHGGDNPEGCSLFNIGVWQCWTHHCEDEYKKNILGFVRGVLSHRRNKSVSMSEAATFCLDFLGENIQNMGDNIVSKKLDVMEIFSKKPQKIETDISRDQIRSKLKIPSKYYLNRGFLEETLENFDVGLCEEENKQMSNRVVVPIYDEDFKYVGCAGRALGNEVKPKWLYSKGFKKSIFYGLHMAKDNIKRTQSVILVEGQGDVWRMHEAGYKQTVGIFGCSVSDDQLLILEESGALNVIVLTDSDEAGEKAYKQIVKKCGRRFNYYRPSISTKDVGDMTIEQIHEELDPQLQGVAYK
tara:strand:+ start:124 stop:1104 length:981 start_codon:yes stop_codon:yes gene_type:complete